MKKHSIRHSIVFHVLFGLAISLIVMLALLFVNAFISSREGMSDLVCYVFTIVSVILSWMAGGFTVGFRNRRNGPVMGALHAGVMLLLLILISLVVRGDAVELFSAKFLLYLLGGTTSSVVGSILGVHFALKSR